MTTNTDPAEPVGVPEVPEVPRCPEVPDPRRGYPVIEFCDHLLTRLFEHRAALLHAERQWWETDVTWFIRRRDTAEPKPSEDVPVATHPSRYFRMYLARFGYHYMGGQVYGGYARRWVSHRGREYVLDIYVSNQHASDLWARVYAHLNQPTPA